MYKFIDTKFKVLALSKDESIMRFWDNIEWNLYCYHSDRKLYHESNMRKLQRIAFDIVYK